MFKKLRSIREHDSGLFLGLMLPRGFRPWWRKETVENEDSEKWKDEEEDVNNFLGFIAANH